MSEVKQFVREQERYYVVFLLNIQTVFMRHLFLIFFISSLGFSQSSIEKAKTLIDKKDYKKAEQEMEAYLETNKKDDEGIELLGDIYGHQKKWDKSIEQYEKLKNSYPNNANYQYKYGGALGMKALSVSKFRALGLIGDVKDAFHKAADLDPNHIDTRWALVELYVSLPGIVGGSFSKALKYAEELENLSKVDGYLAKGYVYKADDEPELAEKYYKLAVKIGGSVTCYEKLINFYESQELPEKAIHTIEEAQKKHQNNVFYYQLGKICADYNIQLDKGEKHIKTFLSNYSVKDGVQKKWAYYKLAQIYKHRNNKSEALQWINKAISASFEEIFLEEKAKIETL